MSMDGQIRVYTEASLGNIYNQLKDNGAVGDFHELFFICVCIAYNRGKKRPLMKRQERFWSRTISPSEWSCFYAIMLNGNSNSFDVVADDKEVLAVMEEYACAGMDVLMEEFLNDYILPCGKGAEPQLDPQISRELPKQLLTYIFDQSSTAPSGTT